MSVFMQPIYTRTVGSGGASSVTFNSIPQGFTDLKVVLSVRSTAGDYYTNVMMSFNGGTTASFSDSIIFGQNSVAIAARNSYGAGATILTGYAPGSTSTANMFSNNEISILKYSSGDYKQCIFNSASENNSSTNYLMSISAGLWKNNDPITSITFTCAGSFVENSTFTLYGTGVKFSGGAPTAPTVGTVTDQAGFASVAFTPAANDQATSYAVISTPSGSTTYGSGSPIVAPAPLGTSVTYQVNAINDRGFSASTSSSAITTANSYASIATIAATSGAVSNFTFTNIPQGYKHLQLRLFYKCTGGNSVEEGYLSFNGAGSNMNAHQLYSTGSSVVAAGNQYNTVMLVTRIPGGTSLANAFGAGIVDILDYASTTKYKTAKFIGGYDLNGSGQVYLSGGIWNDFAPVTSVTFRSNNSFAQYSHAALYGIA
jgi:hypothetical protein